MNGDVGRAYSQRLADIYDRAAEWREFGAEEHPEDLRNARAGAALRAAARYLRELEQPSAHRGICAFVDLSWALVESPNWPDADRPAVVVSATEAANRFFFDKGTQQPGRRDFDRLIRKTFTETLESWRETIIATDPDPANSGLVEYFNEQRLPLWNDDGDDELGDWFDDVAEFGLQLFPALVGCHRVGAKSIVVYRNERTFRLTAVRIPNARGYVAEFDEQLPLDVSHSDLYDPVWMQETLALARGDTVAECLRTALCWLSEMDD